MMPVTLSVTVPHQMALHMPLMPSCAPHLKMTLQSSMVPPRMPGARRRGGLQNTLSIEASFGLYAFTPLTGLSSPGANCLLASYCAEPWCRGVEASTTRP